MIYFWWHESLFGKDHNVYHLTIVMTLIIIASCGVFFWHYSQLPNRMINKLSTRNPQVLLDHSNLAINHIKQVATMASNGHVKIMGLPKHLWIGGPHDPTNTQIDSAMAHPRKCMHITSRQIYQWHYYLSGGSPSGHIKVNDQPSHSAYLIICLYCAIAIMFIIRSLLWLFHDNLKLASICWHCSFIPHLYNF